MTGHETFGERVRRLRQERGYRRQVDLALAMHVSTTAIHFWETGHRQPIAAFMTRLAKHLGVSEDYLRHGGSR